MSSNARVLDVWSHIEPRFGGVGPAASALSSTIAKISGMKVRQIAICDPFEQWRADGIDSKVSKVNGPSARGLADFYLAHSLQDAVRASDICHVHGMWLPHCLAVRRLANAMKKPLVSSVHGMLEPWELRHKRLKKAFYFWLLEKPSLARSSCLRALTDHEVEDYRRFGIRLPIAVVPNGIHTLERIEPSAFLSRFPELTGKSIVLFLGRVHKKKGVLNLLEAWRAVMLRKDSAHLLIAGPEYEDTGVKARQIIEELGLSRSVTLAGILSGETKLAALSYAKYFCLPSFSEGLSVAVLEALAVGLPPIITAACNISSVAQSGSGRITTNEPVTLAQTLLDCLDANSLEWQGMSNAAQKLARSEFSWDRVAKAMQAVYEWLLGGLKPDCVVG